MWKNVGFKAKWVRTNCQRQKMYLIIMFLFRVGEQSRILVSGFSLSTYETPGST